MVWKLFALKVLKSVRWQSMYMHIQVASGKVCICIYKWQVASMYMHILVASNEIHVNTHFLHLNSAKYGLKMI